VKYVKFQFLRFDVEAYYETVSVSFEGLLNSRVGLSYHLISSHIIIVIYLQSLRTYQGITGQLLLKQPPVSK